MVPEDDIKDVRGLIASIIRDCLQSDETMDEHRERSQELRTRFWDRIVNESIPFFKCDVCGEELKDATNQNETLVMSLHVSTKGDGNNKVTCNRCSKAYIKALDGAGNIFPR